MTYRYDLLIASMREASQAVTIAFVVAMLLLLARHAIRLAVDTPVLPVYFRNAMYTAGDLLLLFPIYALIIISA